MYYYFVYFAKENDQTFLDLFSDPYELLLKLNFAVNWFKAQDFEIRKNSFETCTIFFPFFFLLVVKRDRTVIISIIRREDVGF